MSDPGNTSRDLLRHAVATLAYRAAKVVRDAPPEFAAFRVGERSRTPGEILLHMSDLLDWALRQAQADGRWEEATMLPWSLLVERFFAAVERFDAYLASEQPLNSPPEKLFQGAIADALTHVGQLAMLRRLAGAPVRGENYFRADIVAGRAGREQSPPRREFD
jgi:hypothetical protein